MIRPFLLIAIVVHAVALAWSADYSIPKFVIPAPELSIALVESSAMLPTAKLPARARARSITGNTVQQEDEIRNRPQKLVPQLERQLSVANRQSEVSHLKTLLRSAIQEYFVYPPIARKNGWQGRVYVGLTISRIGEFRDIHLVKRSPYSILDTSAVATLKRIGTVPAMQALVPNQGQDLVVPISYRLTEEI
ncbi:MAG: energy transducer TonB [Acidiferrobacterales bacterium]